MNTSNTCFEKDRNMIGSTDNTKTNKTISQPHLARFNRTKIFVPRLTPTGPIYRECLHVLLSVSQFCVRSETTLSGLRLRLVQLRSPPSRFLLARWTMRELED